MDDLPRAFTDITARLEDMHAIAVEGQNRDATPDIHRILANQLRFGLSALNVRLRKVVAVIDGAEQ